MWGFGGINSHTLERHRSQRGLPEAVPLLSGKTRAPLPKTGVNRLGLKPVSTADRDGDLATSRRRWRFGRSQTLYVAPTTDPTPGREGGTGRSIVAKTP